MSKLITMFWGIRENIWSHKRFIAVSVIEIWTIVFAAMYIAACYANKGMVSIPSSVVTMYLTLVCGVLGISATAAIKDKTGKNNDNVSKSDS